MQKKLLVIMLAFTMLFMSGCGIFGGKKDPMDTAMAKADVELKDEAATRMTVALTKEGDFSDDDKATLKEKILTDIEEGVKRDEKMTFNALWDLINSNKENYLSDLKKTSEDEELKDDEGVDLEPEEKEEENETASGEEINPGEDAKKIASLIESREIKTEEDLEKALNGANVTEEEKNMLYKGLEVYKNQESEEAIDDGPKKLNLGQHAYLDKVGRVIAKICRGDVKTDDEIRAFNLNESFTMRLIKIKDAMLAKDEPFNINEDAVLEGVYVTQDSPRKYEVRVKGNKGFKALISASEDESGLTSIGYRIVYGLDESQYVE